MKQGFHICLYKKQRTPLILAYVQGDEAEIAMELEDFKVELLREIGPVTWTFTEKAFSEKVDSAFTRIIRNMKHGATTIV